MGKVFSTALLFLSLGIVSGDLMANPSAKASKSKVAKKDVRQSVKTKAKPVAKKSSNAPKAAKARSTKPATNRAVVVKNERNDVGNDLQRIRRTYRLGDGKEAAAWSELSDLSEKSLLPAQKQQVLQTQAMMLVDAGYPITGAMYAAEVLKSAQQPWDDTYNTSWAIVYEVAKKRDIDNFAENLTRSVDLKGRTPPRFGNSWYYFAGNALEAKRASEAAIDAYRKLNMSDRYFLPAKYQQAMIYVEKGEIKKAETALKAILFPETQAISSLDKQSLKELSNLAYLALGRLQYQEKRFKESITNYRQVTRDSPYYYDALFEQSWAMFMGGYPNHALGSLHGVESPFFEQVFNPEAALLRAISYYWLCRYEDGRIALADFSDRHGDGVEALSVFLERQRLTSDTAYQLFENLISGVSSDSLRIPSDILNSAAESYSMMLLRGQYATVVSEANRLDAKGVFGTKKGLKRARSTIETLEQEIRRDIGDAFLAELRSMKSQYEQLYAQAEFLYLELLMSEKEQLLGRELHASTKISRVDMRQKISGWGKKTQSWNQSDKNEYWWDEVGFYIYSVEPMCTER